MRHRKKFNHLGRTNTHRKAMLSNMAVSLITHKRINTTLAKAKALKMYVEPLITKSKDDTTHSRRIAFSYLKDKEAVAMLFRDISEKVAQRPGGYTRILKTGNRLGDNAEMCFIELVDFNENMIEAGTKKKSTRRRRSSGKDKPAAQAVQSKEKPAVKEDKAAEEVAVVEPTPVNEVEEVAAVEAPVVKAEEVEAVESTEVKAEEAAPEADSDKAQEEGEDKKEESK